MTPDAPSLPATEPPWRAFLTDVARCVRFYSRLPVPALPWERDPHAVPDFATLPRAHPVAGALIGLTGALALAAAVGLGFGSFLAATLAVAALAGTTGGLHEDGLADTADGFWGGSTRERRLEIMRDSRIGAYGATALALALALRIGALAAILDRAGPVAAAAAIVVVAALSRTALLIPLAGLGPARPTGASHAVGRPPVGAVAIAWIVCALVAFLLAALAGLPAGGVALAFGAAALAAYGMTRLAGRLLGGHTGDVGGAAQQLAEIAGLLALLAALRP